MAALKRKRALPKRFLLPTLLLIFLAALMAYAGLRGTPSSTSINGILCEEVHSLPLAYHWHTRLLLYNAGQPVLIPANIGVRPNCMYWLHTHDATGLIHIEPTQNRLFTLSDFLGIWGVNITATSFFGKPVLKPLNITVDGQPYRGDPGAIELRDNRTIVISYDP